MVSVAVTTPEDSRIPTPQQRLTSNDYLFSLGRFKKIFPLTSSKIPSELDWAHLGGVRRSECLEDTPRDTTEDLGDDEHGQGRGEDGEEDEARQSDDGDHHDDLGAVPVRSPAVEL
jgi:hypothetical protein